MYINHTKDPISNSKVIIVYLRSHKHGSKSWWIIGRRKNKKTGR